MKKFLKIFLIIIAIIAIIFVIVAAAAAVAAAATGTAIFGTAAATSGIAGFGAALFGSLGFTSLTTVFYVFGGIALASFLIYDLAFKGGKTVSDIGTSAVNAAKRTFHAATDGLKGSLKHIARPGSFLWTLKILLILAIVGGVLYVAYPYVKGDPND